jgi:hypothetical protein
MGNACSTYGTTKKFTKLWMEKLKGRDHTENLGIDRRIILKRS